MREHERMKEREENEQTSKHENKRFFLQLHHDCTCRMENSPNMLKIKNIWYSSAWQWPLGSVTMHVGINT